MRNWIRTITRAGQDKEVWPVALLLFAIVVPAACLLWFMNAAMHNERAAARQKIADLYLGQLTLARARVEQQWNETAAGLEKLAATAPPPAAFARCLASGAVDSVVLFDARGKVAYPDSPIGSGTMPAELEPKWAGAGWLEYSSKDFAAAAAAYGALATEADDALSARALQAQARCLARAGRKESAVLVIDQILGRERYHRAADPQGRLIVANAELMALELIGDPASPLSRLLAQRLARRLKEYENPSLAAPQRRFLMKELRKHSPGIQFPTLEAEDLAARMAEIRGALSSDPGFHRTPLPDVWQFATPDRRVVALMRTDRLMAAMKPRDNSPADSEIALLPPGTETDRAFVSLPAGPQWPGWQLALSVKDQSLFETTTNHRAAIYLWTGILVVAVMGVLALLSIRLLRRQMALARLKNDLVATVSHELKTPLSSMRVLVDTLLDSETFNENTVREYLHLISRENERLTRLIQNVLTFSRMERNKHTFHLELLPARQVVDAAVEAVRERFDAPGCRFEWQVEAGLPGIMGDPDALATALINLLDNACKYSEDIKHIVLRACAGNGNVIFSVQDNGIGIAPRDAKKIFQHFYQVDRRLSRQGSGCGLGLSIVHYIVAAHGGSVSVESRPGCGSTFTISLPTVAGAANSRKEAIA